MARPPCFVKTACSLIPHHALSGVQSSAKPWCQICWLSVVLWPPEASWDGSEKMCIRIPPLISCFQDFIVPTQASKKVLGFQMTQSSNRRLILIASTAKAANQAVTALGRHQAWRPVGCVCEGVWRRGSESAAQKSPVLGLLLAVHFHCCCSKPYAFLSLRLDRLNS